MARKKKNKLNLIYLVGGEKGGVGKTFTSRALAQYFQSKSQEFILVEADSQINDVGRIYKKQAKKTHTITLSDDPTLATEPDVIFEAATEASVLVNLPSNTQSVLEKWIEQTELLDLMQTEYDGHYLVQIFVSDGCYESIRQLQQSLAACDGRIPHLVILNEGRLNGRDFSYLSERDFYQQLKDRPNFITEMIFPPLESAVQYALDENEWTIEDALKSIVKQQGVLAKQRIVNFQRLYTENFDQAFEELDKRLSEWGNAPKQNSDLEAENLTEAGQDIKDK